eukprot:scaffold4855_cov195-Amphora_coffeaeformis.AAC.2
MANSKSGHPDRRGFTMYMNAALILAGSAAITPFFLHWGIALGQFVICAVLFIALEAISAPPANQAQAFQNFRRYNLSPSRRPVLVCLGDSITHGTASHSYTVDIPTQLTSALAMPPPKATSIFADPLWVVNCGQNHITTHTVWRERLNKALDCHPDYILILIGTNDVRAMYKKSWGAQVKRINELPEIPTLATFTRNFHGILSHIQQASPMTQVGVCTLPPLGENIKSDANKLVRQANDAIAQAVEQAGDKFTLIPVFDRFETILEKEGKRTDLLALSPFLTAFMAGTYQLIPGMIKRNTLGSLVGHKLLCDGIHLNERAGAELVELIVEWLVTKGVAKAIAVKS